MPIYIIVRASGAMLVALLFTAGTMSSQFWDVRSVDSITLSHVTTFLILLCTLAAGHMAIPQCLKPPFWPGPVLAVVFLAGSFYCLTTSAARTVEASIPKVLERLNLNEQRAALERDIAEAKDDLRRGTEAAEHACQSGVGPTSIPTTFVGSSGFTGSAAAAPSSVRTLAQYRPAVSNITVMPFAPAKLRGMRARTLPILGIRTVPQPFGRRS